MRIFTRREKVVFPCKLDPLHLGHVVVIKNMLKKYNVILDIYLYPNRVMDILEICHILRDVLDEKEYRRIYIATHTISYAKSIEQLQNKYPIYTGNKEVYKKCQAGNYNVSLMPRYRKYHSTYMRKYWSEIRV